MAEARNGGPLPSGILGQVWQFVANEKMIHPVLTPHLESIAIGGVFEKARQILKDRAIP